MKKTILFGLIFAVLLGVLGRGTFFFTAISMVTIFCVMMSSIAIFLISLCMGRFFPEKALLFKKIRYYVTIVFTFSALQILSLFMGQQLYKADLKEAKTFCEALSQLSHDKQKAFAMQSDVQWIKEIYYAYENDKFVCHFSDLGTISTEWFYEDGKWIARDWYSKQG